MNGGLCSAVVSAANAGSSVDPSDEVSVIVVGPVAVCRAAPARERVVVERERPVLARRATRR